MFKRTIVLSCLILLLGLSGPVFAQSPIVPQHSDPAWQAAYWNNMTLSGSPVLQRSESTVDYHWGSGSPGPGVPADGFSARWSRYLDLAAGTYRFTTTSDDGMRVYVDSSLIINEWYDHSTKTVSADKALVAGHHLIVVE
ncbi:MAG TPA: PA14 domain-containing protein, partial [Anaerolineae bacterium]|nr:PA14 domain-containing protein [Anaerolineae bacterium]